MFHQNGTLPAPPQRGQSVASSPARTEFLPDLAPDTWDTAFYHLGRQRVAAIPLLRWIYLVLLGAALFWLMLRWPGSWAFGGLCVALCLGLAGANKLVRRRAFVHFVPQTAPTVTPTTLPLTAKIPAYVTGQLGVETKRHFFAGLPGFYRSFATREHALLCQVRPRRFWRIASWPNEEVGLWYAFLKSNQIERVEVGELRFSRTQLPAVAIVYQASQMGRGGGETTQTTTVWLAFPEPTARAAVLADLAVDTPHLYPLRTSP